MKILAIGYVWPEPNSSAAGYRMLALLEAFKQQGWQVDFASPAELSPHRYQLTDVGIKEHQITLNCSSFDSFVHNLQPDVVIFDRYMLEEQFAWRVAKMCPSALRILDLEDLHFLRHSRHQAVKQGEHWRDAPLHTELAIRELAAIYRSDLTLVISEAEMTLLEEQFQVPSSLLLYSPFMAQPNQTITPTFEQRQHFISIGNFRHAPNWDAVLQLKAWWPEIRQQLPQAELHVYGAYPPPKATQLHNEKAGFHVKGWAREADEVLRNARVMLAPLRFGAGLKGKLLDAMRNNLPSVTTELGAEGMCGPCPWPGAICDDKAAFVHSAVSLYTQQDDWTKATQAGQQLLNNRFDKHQHQSAMLKRVEQISAKLEQHRQQHFFGRILQHQQYNTSKYMAQWIEAKNCPTSLGKPIIK